MSTPVIFLGGAPGTGKSTLAAEVGRHFPGVRCLTAGRIIQTQLGGAGPYVRPPVENGAHAAFLQELLVARFARLRQQKAAAWFLDGHFAVPAGTGPAPVAPQVFERLGVTHLALAVQPPEVIEARLRARGGAAWWDGDHRTLYAHVQAEEAHARAVAAFLGISLWRWSQAEQALRDLVAVLGVD